MSMEAVVILSLVTAQRFGELVLSNYNTTRLLSQGAREAAAGHYRYMVALHALWLAGLWWLAPGRSVNLGLLIIYGLLQGLRVWVLASLGRRWTTRIIVLPDAALVRQGPYRYLSHPNYVVVAAEIAVLPLVFGLVGYALVFSALNAIVLYVRIRAENVALGIGTGSVST